MHRKKYVTIDQPKEEAEDREATESTEAGSVTSPALCRNKPIEQVQERNYTNSY